MALARRPRPRPGKLAHDKPLRDFVQDKLKLHWSPEQRTTRGQAAAPAAGGRIVRHSLPAAGGNRRHCGSESRAAVDDPIIVDRVFTRAGFVVT
jgi:hypothetical protein